MYIKNRGCCASAGSGDAGRRLSDPTSFGENLRRRFPGKANHAQT